MRSSDANEITVPTAEGVRISDDSLSVELSDGRTISVPLAWFPRLSHATRKERDHWRHGQFVQQRAAGDGAGPP